MVEPFKVCPICEAPNHRNALVCTTCGTNLSGVTPMTANVEPDADTFAYDYRYGETDLYEGSLARRAQRYTIGVTVAVAAGVMLLILVILIPHLMPSQSNMVVIPPVNTPRPTLELPTVTIGPPTATYSPSPPPSLTPSETATREPCMQRVGENDTLIAIVSRCGHRDLDVIDLVVQINNLRDANSIRLGQMIEVPWPTPTVDPNITPTDTPSGQSDASVASMDLNFDPFAPTATATLQPGVMWYRVQAGDNIIKIAFDHGATVEILSQLNPEVTFSQCDFGEPGGGGSCTVFLNEGQLLRVPAPTPTPTIRPSPSGSETPTPTPTATFNAPSALSPSDRTAFSADQMVTLRWVGTGELGTGQVYHVIVTDQTTQTTYTADTTELSLILPQDWQGQDGQRHEYEWTVSVIDKDNPNRPYFTTEPHTFAWQAREGN